MILIQSEPGNGYPAVNLDAEPGIRAAVKHLAGLGHRRILWLGVQAPEEPWALSRLSAFREAASEVGVESTHYNVENPEVLYGKIEDQIERAVNELRDDLPPLRETTAVMCCNDTVALALCAVLRERGLQVPRDVSVIGFDDLLASFAVPAMTTVSHMLPQIGARAVELALEIMEEGREHPYEVEVKVPAELVVRRSTCEPN
jgi:LacI family transcriptional regulator